MSEVVGYRRPYFNTQADHRYRSYRSPIKRSPTRLVAGPATPVTRQWNIFLQGSDETVFFDF